MHLNEIQKDAILEIINIGIGKGANVLNQVLNHHVTLEVPTLQVYDCNDMIEVLNNWGNKEQAAVEMQFISSISGTGLLVFPIEHASTLVRLFIQELKTSENMDILNISALNEIGNIVINSVVSSFSDILKIRFQYTIPKYKHGLMKEIIDIDEHTKSECVILLCKTSFKVTELDISGNLILMLELGTFNELVSTIDKMYKNMFND